MTAINTVCQPRHKCLQIAADAAFYRPDGLVMGFRSKVVPVPSWPGAITGRGPLVLLDLFSEMIMERFETFDAMVAGIEGWFTAMTAEMEQHHSMELILAGWSAARRQPESYVICPQQELPEGVTDEWRADREREVAWIHRETACELTRLPKACSGPVLGKQMVRLTGWPGIDVDDDPETVARHLRFLIECQRHEVFPGNGRHFIGGYAEITTITETGIVQKPLARWPEDRVGEFIKPRPVDWQAWCATVAAEVLPTGINRQQRRAMARGRSAPSGGAAGSRSRALS